VTARQEDPRNCDPAAEEARTVYVVSRRDILFRYRTDRTWENERWDSTSAVWSGVGDYAYNKLFRGDPSFDEIDETDARRAFPEAFTDTGNFCTD
jgi:hypothetical protein